jgi:TatD DNase family protein
LFAVGSQIDTSKRAVEYAEKYDEIWAIIGLHPMHLVSRRIDEQEVHFTTREEVFNYDEYKKLAVHKKTIGIGECGLDYYRLDDIEGDNEEMKQKQKIAFRKQIELSTEVSKPLVIHCRDAYEDVLEVIKDYIAEKKVTPKAVMHCYIGNKEMAEEFVKLGFYISFSGIITFKNAKELKEVVKSVPIEKIVVETDCPYLSPEPMRGKRNEPSFVEYTAKQVAKLKWITEEEVFETTTKNTKTLFNI